MAAAWKKKKAQDEAALVVCTQQTLSNLFFNFDIYGCHDGVVSFFPPRMPLNNIIFVYILEITNTSL
jgi:hypothetical protein